jgi:hypothetical protein
MICVRPSRAITAPISIPTRSVIHRCAHAAVVPSIEIFDPAIGGRCLGSSGSERASAPAAQCSCAIIVGVVLFVYLPVMALTPAAVATGRSSPHEKIINSAVTPKPSALPPVRLPKQGHAVRQTTAPSNRRKARLRGNTHRRRGDYRKARRLQQGGCDMTNQPEKRGRLIRHLEDALELADEIEDGYTGF